MDSTACRVESQRLPRLQPAAAIKTSIATRIPGYSQTFSINTKTITYNPGSPPAYPTPVDNDTTTDDDRIYLFGDLVNTNISIADGTINK